MTQAVQDIDHNAEFQDVRAPGIGAFRGPGNIAGDYEFSHDWRQVLIIGRGAVDVSALLVEKNRIIQRLLDRFEREPAELTDLDLCEPDA